ncbi:MAG: lipocalin family protein [Saprospiraceae bacterium]|nr:lipocalin family protein [Saprospiraceae bacterium]
MKHIVIPFSVIVLSLVACQNASKQKLVGKWQAVSITEDGSPMPIPVEVVGFEFFPNGYYNFRSTIEYKEAGTFDVKGGLLYTLDTINEASTQKSVQIVAVNLDSMTLRMNSEGKEQIVKLKKVK